MKVRSAARILASLFVIALGIAASDPALAVDRDVVVNGGSLDNPIGAGFGHWEGAELLKISLSAEPGEIGRAEMFAPEDVIWTPTDASRPDPWIFETAAILPDEAFAVKFKGTYLGTGPGTGPAPEWAVAVPDVDLDAEGVLDEREFADEGTSPNGPMGLTILVGQVHPITVALHPKRSGSLELSVANAGIVELFEFGAGGQPGLAIPLPHRVAIDAPQTIQLIVKGKAVGETTMLARFTPQNAPGSSAGGTGAQDSSAVDKLTINVIPFVVDLDVDSNNDGEIADEDDPIEDDASKPGRIIVANRLDYNGAGIPGFAGGINNHPGSKQSNPFTKMTLRIPAGFDKTKATIKFTYSAADPSLVTETAGANGRLKLNAPGIAGQIRVWINDGLVSRRAADVSALPAGAAGDFVKPGIRHKASAIFDDIRGSTATLWVEGIDETAPGAAQISVEVDADGTGARLSGDAVRLTVAWLQLVFTDLTSPDGIGKTEPASVRRIPKDVEADGIACDWQTEVPEQKNVHDGALLLMRVVGSPILRSLQQATPSELSIAFGHLEDLAFKEVRGGAAREGEYLGWPASAPVPDANQSLSRLGIAKPGEDFGKHVVLDARIYRPPYEFDLDRPLNDSIERKMSLAVELSGQVSYRGSKPHAVALVRAPLVLVHGVNSESNFWIQEHQHSFGRRFHDAFGFRCVDFRVAHSGSDPKRQGEGETRGFGEITSMYTFVRDMIATSDPNDQSATNRFRKGDYFRGFDERSESGKRVAVQKVDITAHSYGGLLSRWYIERSGDFADRRDVRKLVTLGTPHKGSPLANVVCEVFRQRLIANASAQGVGPVEPTMDALLQGLDVNGFGAPLAGILGRPLRGALPNSLDRDRTRPRHAYEIFSIGSERLADLNDVAGGKPFHDAVGYAAVVGERQIMTLIDETVDTVQPFFSLQAIHPGPPADPIRPYWPWLWDFNQGANATDSIVPRWSAQLGVPRFNQPVPHDHVDMGTVPQINNTVRQWLNSPLPRGEAHRFGFGGTPPVSERNANIGSKVAPDGTSRGAGIVDRAIVKVELGRQQARAPFQYPGVFGTSSTEVGLRPIALTGMIPLGRIGRDAFTIQAVRGRLTDANLHQMGPLARGALALDPAELINAQNTDFVTFKVTDGLIGRRLVQKVVGPHGESLAGESSLIVYQLASFPGRQSPPARVSLPAYSLPTPTKGGAGNLTILVSGSVEATGVAAGVAQIEEIRLYHNASLPFPDPILEYVGAPAGVSILHPASVFDNLLLPYSGTVTLSIVGGSVRGANASSGANPASVYQYITRHSESSGVVSVP